MQNNIYIYTEKGAASGMSDKKIKLAAKKVYYNDMITKVAVDLSFKGIYKYKHLFAFL